MELDNDEFELQKKLLEFITPFELLPDGVKESTFEFLFFRKQLTIESDRGCALLAASHLEFMLEEALKTKLLGSNKHLNSLFDFNGPLGTFSARILLGYSIGIVSKDQLHDFQLIRKNPKSVWTQP